MKKNIRNIAITAAALTLTAATTLTAFAGEQLAKIQDEGVLKVGIEGTYPPFTYHDDDDNLTGFDVELARAIAEKLGVEAEFTESAWDSLLTAIDTDRIDTVINAVSITEERSLKYDFSNPYLFVGRNIIVRGDNEDIKSMEDLDGKKIATNATNAYAAVLENDWGAEIVPIDTSQQAYDLLEQGRVDFMFSSDITFNQYVEANPDANVKVAFQVNDDVDPIGIPLKKDEPELLEAVNTALVELYEDGTLTSLSEEFFHKDYSVSPDDYEEYKK